MDKVSEKYNGGIESKYIGINSPISLKENPELRMESDSLITYLSMADTYRNESSIKTLNEHFMRTLAFCKSVEDLQNLNMLLQELAKIGGYAVDFYQANQSMLNINGIRTAKNYINKLEENKRKPVSVKVEGGFESKYFNVKYRPNGGLSELDINCSSLLHYMALADMTRNEERINKLMYKFYQTLLLCRTDEDLNNFRSFIGIVAKVGGYAVEFSDKVKELINKNGQLKAIEFIKNEDKKQKANQEKLEDFKEEYSKLNYLLDNLKSENTKDEEDIAYLLRKFNELQSDLYEFTGRIDKNYISECDEQIEESINYLKSLYRELDEINNLNF